MSRFIFDKDYEGDIYIKVECPHCNMVYRQYALFWLNYTRKGREDGIEINNFYCSKCKKPFSFKLEMTIKGGRND